jgi:hypothetical protein
MLEACLDIYDNLSSKSLLKQIINILDIDFVPDSLELLNSLVETKIKIIKEEKIESGRQKLNEAISYLLENINQNQNKALLQSFLTWNSDIETRTKRPRIK